MRKFAFIVSCALTVACSQSKDHAEVRQDTVEQPSTAQSSGAMQSSSAAKTPAPEPKPPPTLGLVEAFKKELTKPISLHRVDDVVLVAAGHRIARVDKNRVDFQYETAETWPGYGGIVIRTIGGTYPDGLDVTAVTTNGRAPAPTFVPLTGEGHQTTFAPGGGAGWIAGIARIGSSTLVAGYSMEKGYQFVGVRGPAISRAFTTLDQAKCTPEEVARPEFWPAPPAVVPYALGATELGTMISFGDLCEKRGPAAEIWDKGGTKRNIVPIGKWIDKVAYASELLIGKGDLAWLVSGTSPIVQYSAGVFTKLPALKGPRAAAFVSSDGVLYAADADAIFRYEDQGWKLEAHLAWPTNPGAIAKAGSTFWAEVGGTLYELTPSDALTYDAKCKHPFVYLYDVSDKSEATYTFPTTRKALSTFEHLARVQLVDFNEGQRRLGLIVPDEKIAKLAIDHIKATMKDEEPKLLCYRPKDPRMIEMNSGG